MIIRNRTDEEFIIYWPFCPWESDIPQEEWICKINFMCLRKAPIEQLHIRIQKRPHQCQILLHKPLLLHIRDLSCKVPEPDFRIVSVLITWESVVARRSIYLENVVDSWKSDLLLGRSHLISVILLVIIIGTTQCPCLWGAIVDARDVYPALRISYEVCILKVFLSQSIRIAIQLLGLLLDLEIWHLLIIIRRKSHHSSITQEVASRPHPQLNSKRSVWLANCECRVC